MIRDAARRLSPLLPLVTFGAGAAAVAALAGSSSLRGAHDALIIMGFDPDRAQLITALLAGAIGAAVGTLVVDRRLAATLLGLGAAAALFASTFLDETRAALASAGDQGRFYPVGWSLTLLALIVGGLAASWSAAVVAGEVRAAIAASVGTVAAAVRARTLRGVGIWRPFLTLALGLVVAVAVPILGDMFNYAPDADMRVGGAPAIGLFGGGGASPAPSANAGSPVPSSGASPGGLPGGSPGASPAPTPNASGLLPPISGGSGATSSARPWLATLPTGSGRIVPKIHLPPPWTGGADPYATLTVYLPPGYAATPARRYPVIYEIPWSFDLWNRAILLPGMLDTLIDEGRIPPVIVAFAATNGAPIPDTECVNSSDGRQQIETYLSSTVVSYMDANFRTIAAPAARTLFGFSTGGFCAPMLLLRHPDVFGQAMAFSGYYTAAIAASQTINAWRPFGGNVAAIASHSPIDLLDLLPAATRRTLYLVVSGDSTEPFYGPQFDQFATALRASDYPYLLLPTRLGHAWGAVRTALPAALAAVAGRWVALGVFGP